MKSERTEHIERAIRGERTNIAGAIMTQLEPITRLSRDLASAAATLGVDEARYLVDGYYAIQEYRKAANNQVGALSKNGEPHSVILWLAENQTTLEAQIKRALDKWTSEQPLGRWAKGITGIGPVISAGLLAYIDLDKAPTVGHIWRFAGLDPTQQWGKGERPPWNASLKTLCWKIGESFVKMSTNESDVYGKVYLRRKAEEAARNECGEYAAQASLMLERKNFHRDTKAKACYESGKLPPAHIHARAKRYAVKLFLAHYHEMGLRLKGIEHPKPYPIAILGHAHQIPCP